MGNSIVTIHDNEGRAGTKIIADGFNRKHSYFRKLINKYKKEFEEIADLESVITKGKTKSFEEYFLNETQFFFLGTLLRNNPQTIKFKLRLVKEFETCRIQLNRALNQKNDPIWNQARLTGKTLRLLETGAIQEFIIYAKEQGGTPSVCDRYYKNFTQMTNTLLFICEGRFKNLRNVLTAEQLMVIGSAEQIIGKSLRDDMANQLFYKEIYKRAKAKVIILAELHGQSEVLDKQLSLF